MPTRPPRMLMLRHDLSMALGGQKRGVGHVLIDERDAKVAESDKPTSEEGHRTPVQDMHRLKAAVP